jgi:hypothetical protein
MQTSPNPAGATASVLEGVACADATTCVAVGYSSRGSGLASALVEAWNGTGWSVGAAPVPAGASFGELTSVSCVSATSCFAVGRYGSPILPLIEHWDGTAWSVSPSPDPAGSVQSELLGVSCSSPTMCVAVGEVSTSSQTRTLVEQWDGSVWAIVPGASPSGAQVPILNAISCASTTSCFAVGTDQLSSTRPTFIDQWNGSAWSVVASPNPVQAGLAGVTCFSAPVCVAVGFGSGRPLIERWNGSAWSSDSAPGTGDLSAVACASAAQCFAVGETTGGVGLIERWDATAWTVMAHPNAGVANGILNAVACASATTCFAVGAYRSSNAGGNVTLIEHGPGTSWAITPSPNGPGSVDSQLFGVACATATSCFAVGSQRAQGHPTRNLVEHYNGKTWAVVSVPHPGSSGGDLTAVSCPSATSCFAAGRVFGGVNKTLVMHWNGTNWSVQTTPNKSTDGDNELHGISCGSPTSCVAVGVWLPGSLETASTLTERWNGSTWTIVPSPNSPAGDWNVLSGVSCPSATSCYTVGTVSNFNHTFAKTLVEHWNGVSWTIVASQNRSSSTDSALVGVSCPTTTTCYTVGTSRPSTTSGRETTVVEHATGGAFTLQASPNAPAPADTGLSGIACTNTKTCLAVGGKNGASSPLTFAARYA